MSIDDLLFSDERFCLKNGTNNFAGNHNMTSSVELVVGAYKKTYIILLRGKLKANAEDDNMVVKT